MVSSDPRGATYYNTGCQYPAQWYVSGSMGSWSAWSPAPHEGLDTLYKETCSPGADCCSIAQLRLQRVGGARGFSGWSLVTYEGLLLVVLFDSTSTIASSFFPTNLDLIKMKEFL